MDGAEQRAGAPDAPPDAEQTAGQPEAARRGPAWLMVGIVTAAVLVCCCSTVAGLALAWAGGLFQAG